MLPAVFDNLGSNSMQNEITLSGQVPIDLAEKQTSLVKATSTESISVEILELLLVISRFIFKPAEKKKHYQFLHKIFVDCCWTVIKKKPPCHD